MTFFVGTFSPGGPQNFLREENSKKLAYSLFWGARNFVGSDYSTPARVFIVTALIRRTTFILMMNLYDDEKIFRSIAS